MLPVVWHPNAEQDLLEIVAFVAEHDFTAAARLGRVIYESAESLAEHPFMYKASLRKPGWREIVAHPNYLSARKAVPHEQKQYREANH